MKEDNVADRDKIIMQTHHIQSIHDILCHDGISTHQKLFNNFLNTFWYKTGKKVKRYYFDYDFYYENFQKN